MFQIIAKSLQRPDQNITMTLAGLNFLKWRKHEPLRPVASAPVLPREELAEDIGNDVAMIVAEEKFDRPLANVAHAPGASVGLLQPARRAQVHHRIAPKPCQRILNLVR